MAVKKISVSCIWICIIGLLVQVHAESESAFGIYGKSVTLKCPLQPTSEIEWYNWVYNTNGDTPAMVYNKDGQYNEDEYHKGRFTVDPNTLDLTISDLNSDDAGEFFCSTSETSKHEFGLSIGRMPDCYGPVQDLREGQKTTLDCVMDYSGQAPVMQWLHGERVLDSVDQVVIGKAQHKLNVIANYTMDKQTYVCRIIVGDLVEDCSLTFDIKYTVRDLTITPEQEAYGPGSEFECSALGNPTPQVTATLPDGEIIEAENRVKVVIPNEWEGMTKSVYCEAKNLYDGMPVSQVRNYTFTISAKAAPESGESGDGTEPTAKNTQMAGIIAGIVIGAVVLVIIIIAVVCIKKRQSKPPKGSKQVSTKDDNDVKA